MVKRVVFIQKFVPHYRLPLFESLRDKLHKNNIEFILNFNFGIKVIPLIF